MRTKNGENKQVSKIQLALLLREILSSQKSYDFIRFLIIMSENHMFPMAFEHADQKAYEIIWFLVA